MKSIFRYIAITLSILLLGCSDSENEVPKPDYIENQEHFTLMNNIVAIYMGDDENGCDSWLLKLYTDMSTDITGNPIGPGSYVQFLIKTPRNEAQEGDAEYLLGSYDAVREGEEQSVGTFQSGYMELIEIAGGKAERPNATFYADLRSGQINMQVDLVSEGGFTIERDDAGGYMIQGCLVGEKCIKRNFFWQGEITPTAESEQLRPNSMLNGNLLLENLVRGSIKEIGVEYNGVEMISRRVLFYVASHDVVFVDGEPVGSGDVLRFEMLLPIDWAVGSPIPDGRYNIIKRDESGSFSQEELLPFNILAGLPNAFYYPELSGTWYIKLNNGEWSDSYALIVSGLLDVERNLDKSYDIYCDLTDCANPENIILTRFVLDKEYFEFF